MDMRWTTDIPSRAVIVQLMAGKQIAFSLADVARLGVADYMSEHTVAVEVLARKVDAQPDALFRDCSRASASSRNSTAVNLPSPLSASICRRMCPVRSAISPPSQATNGP